MTLTSFPRPRICVLAIVAAMLSVVAASTGPVTSVASIQRDIKANGAGAVIKALTSGKGDRWQEVIRRIETGDQAWLNVAMNLLEGTDAGNTGAVYYALSIALTRNAAGVLRVLGPKAPTAKICTVPYIEPTPDAVREYRTKAKLRLPG